MVSVITDFFIICTTLIFLLQWLWSRRKFYRLSWSVNGPIGFPFLGNGLEFLGDQKEIFNKAVSMIEQYTSPVRFWFGPKFALVFHDPDQVEKIMTSTKFAHKDDVYRFMKPFLGESLVSGSGPKWKNARKHIGPFLSTKFIGDFTGRILAQADILCEKLHPYSDGPKFDVYPLIHRCYADVVLETIYGENVEAQSGKIDDFLHYISKMYILVYLRIVKAWLHSDFIYGLTKLADEERAGKSVLDGLHEDLIQKVELARVQSEERHTILDGILDARERDGYFAQGKELLHHVNTIFHAAEDTLSNSASFMILLCGMYPKIQRKLLLEIEENIGKTPDNINVNTIQKLPYMDMCLKEIFRLFPIAPFIMRKTTEDVTLDEFLIPGNCTIIVSIMNIHKDPKYWEKPNEFYPEHFLQEKAKLRHPYGYLPFSAGPRSCLGRAYAYFALKLLIVRVFQKYEIFAEGGFEDMELCADITVRLIGGHNVQIKERVW